MVPTPIETWLNQCQQRVETQLAQRLPDSSHTLHAAMRYSCLNGGKRIRPLLVYLTGQLFALTWQQLDDIALSIELIHTYSLVHDDLPAMDDDDLRRGRPTCHKAYDEATAILAGDALLTLGFEWLSQAPHSATTLLKIIQTLSRCIGAQGMVLGQAQDCQAQGQQLDSESLHQLHQLKTGDLFWACIYASALVGHADEQQIRALQNFSKAFGLGFQVQDDLLDAISTPTVTGKQTQQDQKLQKCTFVTLFGIKRAFGFAQQYHDEALAALSSFGDEAEPLRQLTDTLYKRVAE